MTGEQTAAIPLPRHALVAVLGGSAALLWAYWPTLTELARAWSRDPEYSHGYLVPAFAAFLLWLRRGMLEELSPRASAWGLVWLAAGAMLRLAGAYTYFDWLDAASLVPCLVGVFLLAGGRAYWRWSWPALAFLLFMIPLPYRLEVSLAQPLQRVATATSTFALQTLGFPALAEGNTIRLHEVRIGIVEACSGLRMLVTFFAIATAVLLLRPRPRWEQVVLLASAVPIALAANVTRITATGVLHDVAGSRLADLVFHDVAGWLMMPLALALLGLEMQYLARLFVTLDEEGPPAPLRHA